ncbi:MAG TPA: T9SS type A sorting domain-containing protein, partial [Bacteroidales bacterium]|nr:T9SS type A sorting domain-containing protein [Bacteroidales bacterium]
SNGWVEAAPQGATNTIMPPTVGYTAQIGGNNTNDIIAYLYGEVNNGDITVNVTKINPGPGKGDGWNFIGNPYPSPIDLSKLPYTFAKLNKSASIYISTSMYNGYYGYYNAVLNMSLNGGTRYLAPLHACFLQCNNTIGGTLTFTNSMRSDIVNTMLYKDYTKPDIPMIILAAAINEPNSIKDETAIMFANDATYDNDPDYDIGKLMNTEINMPNIYTITNDNRLAFNGLPYDFNTEIPVGLSIQKGGIYYIEAKDIINLPADVTVYLEDKALGKIQNLLVNPVYTFAADVNSPAEGRFILKFSNNNTSITEGNEGFNFAAWATGEELQVSIRGQKSKGTLQLYDALGRIIMLESINYDGNYTFKPDLSTGTYTIRYLSGENTETRKIFIY